jgi:hypothetical protein
MSVFTDNKYNLEMWQGATFTMTITVKDSTGNVQNLTGYTARMQMRTSYDAGSATESMTTSNGEITVTAAEGNLAFQLAATRTAAIPVDLTNGKPPKTVYVYDLELIDASGIVSKLLYGDVNVYGEVTR